MKSFYRCNFPPLCVKMKFRKWRKKAVESVEQLNLLGEFEEKINEKNSVSWNLWHGCHKFSPGCQHCYVYRSDARYGKDSSVVEKTSAFDLPVRRNRKGDYLVPAGTTVYTCFTSDFFLEDADLWRKDAWNMIRQRQDLRFFFITKRIHRFWDCVPGDWAENFSHVEIGCTVEDQSAAERRLPIFRELPVEVKFLCCEPLLERLDLSPWLGSWCRCVIAGGESGKNVRPCHFDWVLDLRRQCVEASVAFRFKQTGAYFVKDGVKYHIPRKFQHKQAKKAAIDYRPEGDLQ